MITWSWQKHCNSTRPSKYIIAPHTFTDGKFSDSNPVWETYYWNSFWINHKTELMASFKLMLWDCLWGHFITNHTCHVINHTWARQKSMQSRASVAIAFMSSSNSRYTKTIVDNIWIKKLFCLATDLWLLWWTNYSRGSFGSEMTSIAISEHQ